MDANTQQTTQTPAGDQEQDTHFYVMTLAKPIRAGVTADFTLSGSTTPPANWTRGDFFAWLYNDMIRQHAELSGASVMYFTVDRNQL